MDSNDIPPLHDEDYIALARFRGQIRAFLHFSETTARGHGIQPQQHQLLLAIRALQPAGAPTVGEVAGHLAIRHHSAVGLVNRLAATGYIERFPAESDHRRVCLRLTRAGEEKLRILTGAHRDELLRNGPNLVRALSHVIERLNIPVKEENVPDTT